MECVVLYVDTESLYQRSLDVKIYEIQFPICFHCGYEMMPITITEYINLSLDVGIIRNLLSCLCLLLV